MMEKYKILIVEDDVDLREGLSFSFSGDGYDVTETGTKKDGLQEIANGGYDIVFLDWLNRYIGDMLIYSTLMMSI